MGRCKVVQVTRRLVLCRVRSVSGLARSDVRGTLSMSLVAPTRAATATMTSPWWSSATGCDVSGSRAAK